MLFASDQFNRRMFNGGSTIVTTYSTDRLVFEDFSLSDGSVMVLQDLRDSGPTRDLIGGNVPRGDGRFLTGDFFRERTLEATGVVVKSTAATLDAYLDTIRAALRTQSGNLDVIDSNGTVKRYVATCDNFDELFADRKGWNITICPWKARFRCETPFGKARTFSYTTVTINGSPTTESVQNLGTYKALPVIYMIFDSAASVTVVNIYNSATGEEIQYSGTVATNDLLVFDSENKQVLKNGTAVDFTGSFLNLDVGGNSLKFTVTGASFTAYTTITHKTTYL